MRGRLIVVSLALMCPAIPTSAFAAGTLTGHVRNAVSSAPIVGATVFIAPGGLSATTDGTGLYSIGLTAGMYSVTATATDFRAASAGTFATVTDAITTTLDVALAPEALTAAVFDSTSLLVPRCNQPGQAGCDSGTLLVGRAAITGGVEPNQPNTILNSCADGTSGTFHSTESLDRLRVYTLDGGPLASGKTVLVEATVWTISSDRLDLWAANNASQQDWTYLTTLAPSIETGLHTLFATYVLPKGSSLQALRGNLRRAQSPSTCSPGAFDDHDDLAFTVQDGSAPDNDFDGDRVADLALYRPSTGAWLVRQSHGAFATSTTVSWGTSSDLPVPGDYDGDGKADVAVYRPSSGAWYILQSKTNFTTSVSLSWGGSGFLVAPGDYDGDGVTDPTVYSPSSGNWFVLASRSNYTTSLSFSLGSAVGVSSTDVPVPGDYDGDGITDLAIYRPTNGVWYILGSTFSFTLVRYTLGIGGDVPVPGDYDGDGQTDLAVYRPSTGNWIIRFSNSTGIGSTYYTSLTKQWGGMSGDVPVPADYDGDGKTDITIFRPSSGSWFILQSSTNFTVSVNYSWGVSGDTPLPNVVTATAAARNALTVSTLANLARESDFDIERDGRSDISVFRPSTQTIYTLLSRGGFTSNRTPGIAMNGTDIPVPGNYLGWGVYDFPGFYRPSDGTWYGTGLANIQWGQSTDTPVPGDYDGDGRTDLAVYRPSTSTWFVLQSSSNFSTSVAVQWGLSGDIPVPGDYDGDGVIDMAVFRPSLGTWFILKSSTGSFVSVPWGVATDVTVPGDYDGDGKSDVAVYRPSSGTWFILKSSTNFSASLSVQWGGMSGDIPVPGEFDGDGKTDIAIFRPSTGVWWVLQSSTNFTSAFSRLWGLSTDIPILGRR